MLTTGSSSPRDGAPADPPSRPGPTRYLRFVSLGLTGQVLTLAAMVVPILLRRADQVFVLVFTSAISSFLVNAALLAFPFLYPVVRGPRSARVATVASTISLLVVSAAVVGLTPLEPLLGLPRGTFLAGAALTATLGVYAIIGTRLVRAGDTTGIALTRFYYGVLVLTATLAASATGAGELALTYATSLAYTLTALILVFRRTHWGPALPRSSASSRRRLSRAYLARAARPTAATLAGGWTSVLPGLVLPGLGSAAEPWAVVTRICGGFATLMITLVAPPLEARLSRAVRARDAADFGAARRTALLLGLSIAAVAVPSALGLAVYVSDDVGSWFVGIAVATTLFWGSLLAGNLVNRVPNFLGRDTPRLYWDSGRALVLTAVFLLTDGVTRLVVMGAVLAVSAVFLLPLTRWSASPRVRTAQAAPTTTSPTV